MARRPPGDLGRRGLHHPDSPGPGLHRAGSRVMERGVGRGGRAVHGGLPPHDPARRLPPGGDSADRACAPARGRPGLATGRRPIRTPSHRLRAVCRPFPRRRGRGPGAGIEPACAVAGADRGADRSGCERRPDVSLPAEPAGAVPDGHGVQLLRQRGSARRRLSSRVSRRGLRSTARPHGDCRGRTGQPRAALSGFHSDGGPVQPATGSSRVLGPARANRPSPGDRSLGDRR